MPDAIFKSVQLSCARGRATLVPDVNHTAAYCESSTENNSSSDISSKVSQFGVLDPEHQLPPQPQVDQPVAASAVTQGKNVGGASSDPPLVSSITTYGDSDTSQASSLSHSIEVVCSSTAQPNHSTCNSPPMCASHDHTQAQSLGGVGCCTSITTSHADKDSSYASADSHSGSKKHEQAVLSLVEDPTSSPGSGNTESSPNNVAHKDFQFQNNASPQSTDCGATHSPLNSSSTSTSNPEYTPNYLMPGAQSLMFNDPSNHCDPIMQQVFGDTDIMDGEFNLRLYANDAMGSDCDWSKSVKSATPYSLSPQCHTNLSACSAIPESVGDRCSWYQPKTSHSDSINEENHEVYDILQQFM